jgi:hypothetical protein
MQYMQDVPKHKAIWMDQNVSVPHVSLFAWCVDKLVPQIFVPDAFRIHDHYLIVADDGHFYMDVPRRQDVTTRAAYYTSKSNADDWHMPNYMAVVARVTRQPMVKLTACSMFKSIRSWGSSRRHGTCPSSGWYLGLDLADDAELGGTRLRELPNDGARYIHCAAPDVAVA